MGNIKSFPREDRWVCTIKEADKKPDLVTPGTKVDMDSLLTHFKLMPRDPNAKHDAYIDCVKTAQLYMKLMGVKPDLKA